MFIFVNNINALGSYDDVVLRHIGRFEAADVIVKGMEGGIAAKTVTYGFERLMDVANQLKFI